MATSVLDVRDSFAPPAVRGRPDARTLPLPAPRRPPVTVLAAGLIGVLEALGLLAAGLTGLDGLITSPAGPQGWIVALALAVLAGWIVSAAGSGATLVDAAGRRLYVGVALAELVVVAVLFVAATAAPLFPELPGGLPLPALALLAVSVPVGKLLLAGTPSALAWVAAGPRTCERRPDPVAAHRLLCTLTLAGIGLGLTALAVLTPVPAAGQADVASVVSQP